MDPIIVRPESEQPIPPYAKRVFKGVIFDVYQWEQEMFNGTKKTFERMRRPDTTVVIPVTPEGKIVVTEQEQPGMKLFIGVAGGRGELDEEPLQGAKRELLEETGYESDAWALWLSTQPVNKIDWAVYTFIARNARKVAEMQPDSGEKIALRLVSFEEFASLTEDARFAEPHIAREFAKAKSDPQKMVALRELFLG